MTKQAKLLRFVGFGLALAIMAGYCLPESTPSWFLWFVATAVVGVSWALSGLSILRWPVTRNPEDRPAWAALSPEKSVPRYGSRRCARALYHNGVISIEELATFCAQHPEDPADPDR